MAESLTQLLHLSPRWQWVAYAIASLVHCFLLINVVAVGAAPVPRALALAPGANPFRRGLDLVLDLDRRAPVVLEVFDAGGRRVTRWSEGTLPAGVHRLRWNGADASGADAGAGLFWVRATAGGRRVTRQVVRLR